MFKLGQYVWNENMGFGIIDKIILSDVKLFYGVIFDNYKFIHYFDIYGKHTYSNNYISPLSFYTQFLN